MSNTLGSDGDNDVDPTSDTYSKQYENNNTAVGSTVGQSEPQSGSIQKGNVTGGEIEQCNTAKSQHSLAADRGKKSSRSSSNCSRNSANDLDPNVPSTSASSGQQRRRLNSAKKKHPRHSVQAMSAVPRIRRELRAIARNPSPNFSAEAHDDDIFHWTARIQGPPGTVYEGGTFLLDVRFPPSYPFRPPRIRFSTRIYHCNIDSHGYVCLDVLNERWSPVYTISNVFLSVWLLLGECNPNDPLVMAIADQYQTQRAEHDNTARQWVRRFAATNIAAPAEIQVQDQPQQKPSKIHAEKRHDQAE